MTGLAQRTLPAVADGTHDTHDVVARATAWGAFLGLAWGLSLRAWMAVLQVGSFGYLPEFTWWGTFGAVAAPAVVTGAVLGWAEGVRRVGGRRGWRWAAAAPLLMVVPVALTPGFVETLVDTGLGGGAIAVSLIGLVGGHALSGRGTRWARAGTGAVAAGLTLATAGFTHSGAPEPLGPGPVFGALLLVTLMVLFALGASIPHRPVGHRATRPDRPVATSAAHLAEAQATTTVPPGAVRERSRAFRVGWSVLALLAAAGTVHSVVLAFVDSDDWVAGHAGWAALSATTLLVLAVPYRAAEAWAWWAVWAFVAAHAVVGVTRLDDPMIGYWYLGATVVLAMGQALTWPDVAAAPHGTGPGGARHPRPRQPSGSR